MFILPTVSSSTPMSDWFANMNQLYNIVQQQAMAIQAFQERIAVLESHARIVTAPVVTNILTNTTPQSDNTKKSVKLVKLVKEKKVKAEKPKKAEKAETADDNGEPKKRGRKPVEVNLSEFLREGEQIIARIPLGDRQFDEHAVAFREGKLVLEDGQVFDHPTTLVGTLAKILEDIGERSTECSKSMNGWILCTVSRDGKRVPLEKLKPSTDTTDADSVDTIL